MTSTTNLTATILKSSALAALCLFACADSAFRWTVNSGRFDRFEAANHRWTWWQVKGYKELPYTPDVVMFGSSLLTRIVNEGDATYLKHSINATRHNRSQQLEDCVQSRTGVPIKTFAFNLAGLHASDAAVVANGLLRDKTPSTIIYTIAPRDFLDNLLEAPYTTEQFELMGHTTELGELAPHARLSTFDRISFAFTDLCNKISEISKCKYELATTFERNYRALVVPVIEANANSKRIISPLAIGIKTSAFDYSDNLPVAPEDPKNIEKNDNLQCYRFCYQPFRPKLYNAQFYYLDYFLRFAEERGIKVILVNMPLRQDNLTAMMPNFYELYKSDVNKHAAKFHAQVIDLFDSKAFTDDDFIDTVHLTGHGSVKLVDKLAAAVAPDIASTVVAQRNIERAKLAGQNKTH
ncbi:MAG TPA: hypothetical protein V6C89_10580 [Drouetiella sp.]